MRALAILALAAAVAGSAMADGVTVYVDNSATGANNGSSWKDAYTTLTAAITDAKFANNGAGGCVILIAKGKGEYRGEFELGPAHSGKKGSPNTIKAKEGETPALKGEGKKKPTHGFTIKNAAYIALEGLDITPADKLNKRGYGVYVRGKVGECVLRGLRVHDAPVIGITFYGGSGSLLIERCVVWRNGGYNMYFRGLTPDSKIVINHCTTWMVGGSKVRSATAEVCIRKNVLKNAVIKNTVMYGKRRSAYFDIVKNLTLTLDHNAHKAPYTYGKLPATIKKLAYAETDVNLSKTDPGFTDPEKGDFTLKPDSPLRGKAEYGANIGAYPQ